ncbi:copper/silver-translocating P-type ATPase [Ruminiclostridium sufflavum DSM 19573]|uniref:Cd(2+)-exporting ATPase n=1 Tax=Ruminiclostridium sufflavum DSM 19573 TaxID=1121337 RepID=A0A318XQM1_9FIRM|nr:cation-translocating P-type ATPase [Ruminiclostridium sufflavum]PYG90405.1 copper/silver-translocating P-type ATPase [Ruminiclostridium sufflavum DSM 19573]
MLKFISIKKLKNDSEYRTIALTVISGVFLVISWFGWLKGILPFDAAWLSIVISGTPILYLAITGLFTRFDIRAGVLVSIALVASVAIGEYFAAGEVAFIMMIGEVLENRTVRKAQEGLKKLIQLTPQVASVRTPSGEKEIPAEQVQVGDIILVKPGEAIPVDGIIVSGQSSINQAIITGESMPIDKTIGDEVYVGTLNQMGVIEVKATKVGQDTSLSKLIRMVKEAEDKKAPVVRVADKWATIIVPIALALSVIAYIVTRDITRAVTILVVFCPCALVLATPTAIMAGIGNASRKGILIKSGEAMEKVGRIDTIAFDKTGTITNGKPEVVEIVAVSQNHNEDSILLLASIAEKFSEHPLGKAIYAKAVQKSLAVSDPQEFKIDLGLGVRALIDNKTVSVGNYKLLALNDVAASEEIKDIVTTYESQGKTVMLVAQSNAIIGLITVADRIKPRACETIQQLKNTGIKDILLLTGDNRNTALSIAKQVAIDNVYAGQLPQGKVSVIEKYMKENKKVCMIGDGINDAPALAISNIGVAMGALGTDIAVETADIALMSDDLSKIPEMLMLSKKVLSTITVNIIISMAINIIAVLLAALGILSPIVGALVHNFGSVLVVMNSAALLKYKGS